MKAEKFNSFDLSKKLNELGWKGLYYTLGNETTYLSGTNDVIAVVTYDNRKSLILGVEFKNETRTKKNHTERHFSNM